MNVDKCYIFDFDGNTNLQENLSESHLTVVARSNDLNTSEEMTLSVMNELDKLTNIDLDNTNVILIKKVGKHATYNGEDERGRYYFSARFRMVLDDK